MFARFGVSWTAAAALRYRPIAVTAALPTGAAGAGACDGGSGGFADRCRKAGACDGAREGDQEDL
jgi:hypothetical protein